MANDSTDATVAGDSITDVMDTLERTIPGAYRSARGLELDGDAVLAAARGLDRETGEVGYDDGEPEFEGRTLVTGGDPDARAKLPGPTAFTDAAGDLTDYAQAPDVERIANLLIARCRDLRFLGNVRVRYLWRRKAQAKNGKMVLGTCQKLSGLPQYGLGGGDFLIVLNRENCGLAGLTAWQLEALVYHEMNHIAPPDEGDPSSVEATLIGHDVEEFRAVIDRYGLWLPPLREVAPSFVQAKIEGL